MRGLVCFTVVVAGLAPGHSALADNPTQKPKTIRTAVLIYDPILKSHGAKRLSQYRKWHDPKVLTKRLVESLAKCSGGYAKFEVVSWVEIDAFPKKRDGFVYDEATFLAMLDDTKKAHQPDTVRYRTIFETQKLDEKIRRGDVDEVWLWGAPYFGTDEYAGKIVGDEIFYPTENPWFYRPYDIPDCGRSFWVMGFNYERGEAEALHSFGHRVEGQLSLTVGKGVWDAKKTPENAWNRFTRQQTEFPGASEVGNVHGGPNAESGYDYAQRKWVESFADQWYFFPKRDNVKKRINCETWGGPDYHLNYMKWWLDHLPKNPGVHEGFSTNWWEYVVDYDAVVKRLPPPGGKPQRPTHAIW